MLCALAALPLAGQERLTFVGVALDQDTRDADRKLQDYFQRTAGVSFAPEDLEYQRVIDRLSGWRPEEGPYLARTTPFVYVAAEMLGADFELLATYVSEATGQRFYHSYLVVRRQDFPEPPSLGEIIRFLGAGRRKRFVYHSRFSTSSFFLPSLVFRRNRVYHMAEATDSLIAIDSTRIDDKSPGGRPFGATSSRLVEQVARGEADLAAIWDGTRDKFAPDRGSPPGGGQTKAGRWEEFGRHVHFVRLPTALPNDLLVCSSSLDGSVKDRLRAAVSGMTDSEIRIGDFRTWQSMRVASDARLALADLRWLARERPAPITVEVRLGSDTGPPGGGQTQLRPEGGQAGQGGQAAAAWVEAARQAVRLSGTELVVYDQDFHEHVDFTWTLDVVHDGAVVLRSSIPGSEVAEQVFRISFANAEDLARRIVAIVASRLHRIRYAWAYSGEPPVVIRDLADPITRGSTVKVQRISWIDPERNDFRAGPLFDAAIRDANFHRYELESDDFPRAAEAEADFDAMSNVSYRVLLLRAPRERRVFRVLTVVFVVLLAAAAGIAVFSLFRPSTEGDSEPTQTYGDWS